MRRISLPLWLVSVLLYIFLYAPIVVVIVYSFNASRYGGPWRGFTTEWYPSLFDNADKLAAAKNTFILAFVSTGERPLPISSTRLHVSSPNACSMQRLRSW